ncbi:DUF4365 domain-containing protein, partial [Candidatus Latescibacterota bacterium]
NEESTGIIFKVQIKGTENPKFNSDNTFTSFSLSLDDVIYFCEELNVPTFFILCDVTNSKTWWHAIQLDSDLRAQIQTAQEKKQASLTVHIDSRNEISETPMPLFKKVLESEIYLSARSISSSSVNTLYSSFASAKNLDEIINGFDRGKSTARRVKLERLWDSRDTASIENFICEILDDTNSLIEEKFSALYYSEIIEMGKIFASRESTKIQHDFAVRRKEISSGGPLIFRADASLSFHAAKLHQLAHDDLYLFMNNKVIQEPENKLMTDPVWNLVLPSARILASRSVERKFRHCLQLIDYMINHNILNIVPQNIARVLMSIQPFLTRLWYDNMFEAAQYYEKILENIAKIAIDIAIHLKNWKDVSLISMDSILIGNMRDHESIVKRQEWAKLVANNIEDNSIREQTLSRIDKFEDSIYQSRKDSSTKLELEIQIYKGMAASMGIDIDNPDDPLAQIVRIGIKDLDPTRILKNCKYLYISLGSIGLPARMLQLYTAGNKTLHCTLHKYYCGALSLDETYNHINNNYCSKCKDKSEYPKDWKWSREWQKAQFEIYGENFKSFV